MANLFDTFAKLADDLDKAGLGQVADRVDKTAKEAHRAKTAQYVGVQGYWVRNTRCWQNCYRQKRASNKEMPAQEVWQDCHNEYVESINNDESGWERYASENTQLTKFAQSKSGRKAISTEQQFFKKALSERVENGWPVPFAVQDASEAGLSRHNDELLKAAEAMVGVAEFLHSRKRPKLSGRAEAISAQLVKEAAPLSGMLSGLMGKGKGDMYQQYAPYLQQHIAQISQLAASYNNLQDASKLPQAKKQLASAIKKTLSTFQYAAKKGGYRSNALMALSKAASQYLVPAFQQLQSASDLTSFSKSMGTLAKAVTTMNQQMGSLPSSETEEAQQPEQQTQPEQQSAPIDNPTPPPSPVEGEQPEAGDQSFEQQVSPANTSVQPQLPTPAPTQQMPPSNPERVKMVQEIARNLPQAELQMLVQSLNGIIMNKNKQDNQQRAIDDGRQPLQMAANVKPAATTYKFADFARRLKQKKGF